MEIYLKLSLLISVLPIFPICSKSTIYVIRAMMMVARPRLWLQQLPLRKLVQKIKRQAKSKSQRNHRLLLIKMKKTIIMKKMMTSKKMNFKRRNKKQIQLVTSVMSRNNLIYATWWTRLSRSNHTSMNSGLSVAVRRPSSCTDRQPRR